MLLRMASFSRLLFENIVGACALDDFAGGPLGGNSISLGLVTLDVGVLPLRALPFLGLEDPELEFELKPEARLVPRLVGVRETVRLVLLASEGVLGSVDAAVKVSVKYCSSSVAQTEIIIFA